MIAVYHSAESNTACTATEPYILGELQDNTASVG